MLLNNSVRTIKLVGNIIRSNYIRLKLPYKLTFALTYNCDLKCRVCHIWSKKEQSELSVEEITNFFKRQNHFSWIDLTGGEIFTRLDIEKIVNTILKLCRSLRILHFPTNGQFPDRVVSLVKKIIKDYADITLVITVSLDGSEELNDQIKGKKGAWARAIETFIRLKELGVKNVNFGYTISEHNQGKLGETILEIQKIYPDLGYSDFHINLFQRSSHYYNNHNLREFPMNDVVRAELDQFSKQCGSGIKRILEKKFISLVPGYRLSKSKTIKCQALSSSCFIDPYGDIYPCISYGNKLSNIKTINNDFYGFWNTPGMALVRKGIIKNQCPGCWSPCEAYPALLGSLWRFFA